MQVVSPPSEPAAQATSSAMEVQTGLGEVREVIRSLVLVLVVGATLVAAAPAQGYSSFRIRSDAEQGTFYVGTTLPAPTLAPHLAFASLTGPDGRISNDVIWRFARAGTLGSRGATLVRIVNRGSGKCLEYASGLPALYPCGPARAQLWSIWSGGAPLRGSGNLPSGGPGYSFRSERHGSFRPVLSTPNPPFAVGRLLDMSEASGRVGRSGFERFSIRPLGP